MIEHVAGLVDEKAKAIAEQEVSKYVMDNPGVEISSEIREIVRQRAHSQLTFHLAAFRSRPDEKIEEAFEAWFSSTQEEDLRKACNRAIKEELGKIAHEEDENLSFLDKYLRDHKRGGIGK